MLLLTWIMLYRQHSFFHLHRPHRLVKRISSTSHHSLRTSIHIERITIEIITITITRTVTTRKTFSNNCSSDHHFHIGEHNLTCLLHSTLCRILNSIPRTLFQSAIKIEECFARDYSVLLQRKPISSHRFSLQATLLKLSTK